MSNKNKPHFEEQKIIKIKSIERLRQEREQIKNLKPENEEINDVQKQLVNAQNELNALLKDKELLVQETKEKIKQEKINWESEKTQWIEEAKDQGYKTGYKLGQEESLNKYQQLIDKANDLTALALKDYHATVDQSNETILDLAVHTAEKILDQQFIEDPDSFITIVKTAIKEIKDQPVITIYLHPDNYPFVLQQKEELIQILENDCKLSIYSKEDITENSCLIEHPFGQIDASIDTQLQQIRSALYTIAMENKK